MTACPKRTTALKAHTSLFLLAEARARRKASFLVISARQAIFSLERLGVQVLGATGQQEVTAVPWIPPLRIANWSLSCVMALPGLQKCPARSPDKWQPEMELDPISQVLKISMFARELPGVSLGLTNNRQGTCAILPDGDGHMLVPAWVFW